jgi:hypothetical protein
MVGNIYITGGASWQTTDVNTSTAEEIFTLLNVGVGKNDPNYKLDVDGDAKVSGTLFLRDTAGNIGKIIDSGGNLDLYADGTIRFFESDANKEMIRFDINSNNDDGRMSFEGDTDTYFNHPGDNQLGFTIGGTDTLRLKDGNVGIGTATPTDILDINSDSASAVTNMYLRNHANLGGAALSLYAQGTYASPTYRAIIGCSDAGGNIRMGAHSNHDLLLLTNNDAKITIKSDGKVGVGTATPAQKLDVDGTIRFGTSNISSGTHTFTASAGSAVTADTTAVGSCSAVEYTIFVSNSTNIQSQKVLIMDNGTTAYSQEFAMMSNPNMIATFSADVSGSNVRLLATPETGISGSTTIKFTKTIIE